MSSADRVTERVTSQRLFFALWPNAEVRRQLTELATHFGQRNGRPLPAQNLHMTLAFIGQTDPARRACLEQAAAALRGCPFTLHLDRLGFWPRPKVLWAGTEATPLGLQTLVQDLEQALTVCGYRPEARPYQPHVTLARKARAAPPVSRIPSVVWPVEDFCLAESVTAASGAEYRVLAHWSL